MTMSYEQSHPGAEITVILGSSLGADRTMWSDQVRLLPREWNVVAFDLPGHGSSAPAGGSASIGDYADGVIAIADDIGAERFAYCGLSIGGVIGQELGARHPDRLLSLVLASTGLTILTPEALASRAARVRAEGTAWIADVSAERWFSERFRADHADRVTDTMRHLREMDPEGYAAACEALSRFDGHDLAPRITAPTLVVYGDEDHATSPSGNQELAGLIPGSRLESIPGAAHICNVEEPELFTEIIAKHIAASQ